MDKIGICIAGYGEFARKELHPRLAQMGECEVRYLYHPDPEKAKSYGPLGAYALYKVFADPSVDAFVIASPNDRHFGILRRILEDHPRHIFVEKPMVNEIHHAVGLRSLVEKAGKVFMVGHCHRRGGVYRKAKELLDAGAIGKIVNVNFNYSSNKVFTMRKDEWRASAARTDLGPLTMVGSHCVDTIHYLFGKVNSVYAQLANLTGLTESPDTSSVMMNLESGAMVLLQCNYNVPMDRYCFISGTDGAIYIDGGRIWLRSGRENYTGAKTDRIERQELTIPRTDPIMEELQEFLNAIRFGTKVETGYEEGLAVVQVLDACRQSAKEDKLIRLS